MPHFGDRIEFTRDYLSAIFAEDIHAKRIDSMAGATLGVMANASLSISAIGHALAQERCQLTKHAVKQVDRLLSNQGIVVWDMFGPWVAEMVGQRRSIVVAMEWTDFDADDQTTQPRHEPRSSDAVVVADGVQGRVERQAQRL